MSLTRYRSSRLSVVVTIRPYLGCGGEGEVSIVRRLRLLPVSLQTLPVVGESHGYLSLSLSLFLLRLEKMTFVDIIHNFKLLRRVI